MDIAANIKDLKSELPEHVTLVAVSKTYPESDIAMAYEAGQRVFGESRPQELKKKQENLPGDIEWHMIGHLQTNKVKYIAPFVRLIHSVDSEKLLAAIDKEAAKNGRVIDVLMEVYIASEETKHGWDGLELRAFLADGAHKPYQNVRIRGLMGIASYTSDTGKIKQEFRGLQNLFTELREGVFGKEFDILSMGMTSDYKLAVECGSNMVRIGSMIFGEREYPQR